MTPAHAAITLKSAHQPGTFPPHTPRFPPFISISGASHLPLYSLQNSSLHPKRPWSSLAVTKRCQTRASPKRFGRMFILICPTPFWVVQLHQLNTANCAKLNRASWLSGHAWHSSPSSLTQFPQIFFVFRSLVSQGSCCPSHVYLRHLKTKQLWAQLERSKSIPVNLSQWPAVL